jgi:hypothetical protein
MPGSNSSTNSATSRITDDRRAGLDRGGIDGSIRATPAMTIFARHAISPPRLRPESDAAEAQEPRL